MTVRGRGRKAKPRGGGGHDPSSSWRVNRAELANRRGVATPARSESKTKEKSQSDRVDDSNAVEPAAFCLIFLRACTQHQNKLACIWVLGGQQGVTNRTVRVRQSAHLL